MDNQDNQNQQDAAANQSMDAGIAAGAAPQGDPNVDEAKANWDDYKQELTHQAPSVEEKLAAQNEANLQKAVSEGGYKPEPEVSLEQRKKDLIADMEHAVKNNGPITVAMLREMRELLGVEAR